MKKFSKLKESRKKVVEKSHRFEQKVAILTNKLNLLTQANEQSKKTRPTTAQNAHRKLKEVEEDRDILK